MPAGSVDSWVGCPRIVTGDAASVFSIVMGILGRKQQKELMEKIWRESRENLDSQIPAEESPESVLYSSKCLY